MTHTLDGPDRVLLDRYLESVLLRFSDGKYSLAEATQELAQTFTQPEREELLAHLRGVIEAGDDA
ncbi:hypothetical protein JKL49_20760 [Phenylobacterium sp. 20VBR1]|uniref:Uncharacterized protein n=1 Tax=Phenylobacterium glaciei TaxID=2803784 RepID=A0A941D3W4_9CAUL|nr:hypothetical protein [Phenylobacterium glaciei]MBR7621835.1 hypothetical protein [Phenylobacterium glaciei]QQZ50349.1 hypothetical protein JKL49_01050 [Phenylobacterium glaciei]